MNDMFYLIKSFYKRNTKILKNLSLMSVFSFADLVMPLISFPYRARVLGIDNFGTLILIQIFFVYLCLIIDFGFNISGLRLIAVNKENNEIISKTYSSIIIIKTLIGVFVYLIALQFFIYIYPDPNFVSYFNLSSGVLFGQIFFARWLFQGLDDFKSLVIISLISKSIFTILIFVLLKDENDLNTALIIHSIGGVLLGLFSVIIVFFKYKIKIVIPKFSYLINVWTDSSKVFWSLLISNFYLNLTPIFLDKFLGKSDVAFYGIADKLIQVMKMSYNVITQVTFPTISNLMSKNINDGVNYTINSIKISVILPTLLFILTLFYGEYFIVIIFGNQYLGASIYLKIMSILPLICSLSSFSLNGLYSLKLDHYITKILGIGLFVFILSFFIMSKLNISIFLIFPIILTELVISILAFRKLISFKK